MKCSSCQNEISDSAKFCPHCGTPVTPVSNETETTAETSAVPPTPSTPPQVQPPVPPVPPVPPQPTYQAPIPPQPMHRPQRQGSSANVAIIVAGIVAVVLIAAGTVLYLNRSHSEAPDEPVLTENVDSTQPKVVHDTVVVNKQANAAASAPTKNDAKEYYGSANTVNPTKVVVTGQSVRLRLAPSTTAGTLTYTDGTNVHPRLGEVLEYLGEEGDFYNVRYKGYDVYISKKFSVAK